MTIRKRLILSQIAVFLIPLLMTLVVLLSALAGLLLYVRSGNHLMAESAFQFNNLSQIIHTGVFHYLHHSDDTSRFAWVVEIIDPVQNYVIVDRDGEPIYHYGNEALVSVVDEMKGGRVLQEVDHHEGKRNVYTRTEAGRYYFLEKQTFRGADYHLYFVSRQLPHGSDEAIEDVFHGTMDFIIFCLIVFIVLASWFLSRFIGSKIMPPLAALKKGAEEIRDGNLDVHLEHKDNDEFKPAVEAFNLMARELKESLAERERQEDRRKELIASISHDIRTPLTAIKAYVEGLLDHVADTPEKQEHYLQVIRKKTDVLDTMVEQLFLLSKMDLGEKAIPLETLELGRVVRETVEENRPNWEGKGALLSVKADEGLSIRGSHMLLERVVENLVNNSIKYKNSDTVHITVNAEKRDGSAVLSVADDGPGVPEEALPRLTEAFYRTDKARSKTENGSGLGLAIVAGAASMMHGTVAVGNREPHGLEIKLVLPMKSEREMIKEVSSGVETQNR